MTSNRDIDRLTGLAQLVLDHRLVRLRSCAVRLDQSRAQLSAVNEAPPPDDLEPIVSSKVALGYERWADTRRAELNIVIARQTADWMDASAEAQAAFGRVQVLQSLKGRKSPE